MSPGTAWLVRARTLQAMALLCVARLAVGVLPFAWWRMTIGRPAPNNSAADRVAGSAGPQARRLALHVERGATRLPFATKCLPRALALCWLLRWAGIGYVCRIAARPAAARSATADTLHAWVEAGGRTVLGELPGPWLVVVSLRG